MCPRWLGDLISAKTLQAVPDNDRRLSALHFPGQGPPRCSVTVDKTYFARLKGQTTWLVFVSPWYHLIRSVVVLPDAAGDEGKSRVEITLHGSNSSFPAVVEQFYEKPRQTVSMEDIHHARLLIESDPATALMCELIRLFRARVLIITWFSELEHHENAFDLERFILVENLMEERGSTEVVAMTEIASENGDRLILPVEWTWPHYLSATLFVPLPREGLHHSTGAFSVQ